MSVPEHPSFRPLSLKSTTESRSPLDGEPPMIDWFVVARGSRSSSEPPSAGPGGAQAGAEMPTTMAMIHVSAAPSRHMCPERIVHAAFHPISQKESWDAKTSMTIGSQWTSVDVYVCVQII